MIYISILLFIVSIEIIIKDTLDRKNIYGRTFLNGRIELISLNNYGVIGGLFQKKSERVRFFLSMVLGISSFVFVIMLIVKKSMSGLAKLSYALILGGGLSNLLDRYRYGYVKDYFVFPKARPKRLRNIVFNLGDLLIFAGAFLYLFRKIIKGKR